MIPSAAPLTKSISTCSWAPAARRAACTAYLAASSILNSPVFVAALLVGAAHGRHAPEIVFALALGCALTALASSLALVRMRAGVPIERQRRQSPTTDVAEHNTSRQPAPARRGRTARL